MSCDRPQFTRVRCGRGFRHRDSAGEPLTDPGQLARIRALVILPAWQDVWICPWPGGHLQAVGTDDAGRRQCLYRGDRVQLPAKGGTEIVRALVDEQVHSVVRALLRRPRGGERLLAYWERRRWHELHGDTLSRLGEHGRYGRPATHGAVEAAVLELLGG
ncbi:hypothetical protein ACIQ6Y_01070 [Streptomyces sp. NPDC096205]|uniref:hypothetical protein n=1 Tax=Streptomyces sp. NPDC096205 TaxID=3366081 RepID=UPI0038077FB7